MEVYVLDSNFFIQAHRVSYPLDIAFSFWNKVKQLADEGRIISIDKVKNELYDKNDALETSLVALSDGELNWKRRVDTTRTRPWRVYQTTLQTTFAKI